MTMVEIPGREYRVTNIEGKQGLCEVSTVQANISGEPVTQTTVSDGKIVTINLQNSYDTFENCVVWFEGAGNG